MTTRDDSEEGRRQAYLAALGIPLWSPRHPLPGALPSEPLEFVPYVSAEMEAEAVVFAAAPAASAVVAESLPAPVPQRAAMPTPATQSDEVYPQQVADQEDSFPRFICRVQALAPGWSAVVTLGDAPDLSAQELRLLGNISQALGGDMTTLQPCEHLRWPLNRNPALDHSAKAMVEWITHALKLPPGRCVVFGEKLAAYVREALPRHAVIAAPLLSALLENPIAKRNLAQALHG